MAVVASGSARSRRQLPSEVGKLPAVAGELRMLKYHSRLVICF